MITDLSCSSIQSKLWSIMNIAIELLYDVQYVWSLIVYVNDM